MEKNGLTSSEPPDPEKSHGFRNILNTIILIAGLVGAWFLLDWLMGGK
ncbi:MAG: hypothetical protein M0R70_13650 [Nitrospirae bacterium]|nr:hypothetical protein [Nitrospirota bacterium]